MRDLLQLCYTFAKIGLFSIGGGYTMLPMMQREVVEKHHWLNEEEMINVFAVGQSTPGAIAVNVAMFVGAKQKGFIGGLAATFGMVLPSLIIILLIAGFLDQFRNNHYVASAFTALRASVVGLLMVTVWQLKQKSVQDALGWILMTGAFAAIVFFSCPVIWVILSGGAAGIIFYTIKAGRGGAAAGAEQLGAAQNAANGEDNQPEGLE